MAEVVVIGGGPAGVTAALRARELGAEVALIERGYMGGTSANDGCVPTRVLAHAARLVRDAEQFADYGLDGPPPAVDFARLLNRTQRIVYEIQEKKQLKGQLEASGTRVLDRVGDAAFSDSHTVTLGDGTTLEGDKFVLCAGGHARRIPFPGAEHALTHSEVWTMRGLPRSVAVVGGAATGCQLASVFAAFGARTVLLDLAPRVLPGEDEVVSEGVAAAFERRGIRILTGIGGVERIEKGGNGLTLFYAEDGVTRSLEAEAVVLAAGWPGNADGLNLGAAGVEASRGGYVQVDDLLRTSAPHVFAAGDVTGRRMLVQSATYEGRLAAEGAVLGDGRGHAPGIVPHGGFTDPEYGGVGLTEEQARAAHGEDCVVAVVPYADLDRGVIDGRPEGFCKLIVDRPSRRVLGAHIVGEQAVEVVQIVATAMRAGMPIEQLADVEFAYPTFTGVVGLAARRATYTLGLTEIAPRQDGEAKPIAAEWERHDQRENGAG